MSDKTDSGCLSGCVGVLLYTALYFGGIGLVIYCGVRFVKWVWYQ
jgi:hypothetical protein